MTHLEPRTAMPPDTICRRFLADASGRRCQHYLDGGFCALEREFRCVEWLRKNGQADVADRLVALQAAEIDGTSSRWPFELPPGVEPSRLALVLSEQAIEAWRTLGVDAVITSPSHGEIWIVAEYTGRTDRTEIRFDHAVALSGICAALPAAHLASLKRRVTEGA